MAVQQKKAFFTRAPRVVDEIGGLSSVESLRAFTIEKTIILPKGDFINFSTDMTVERLFLRKNFSLCRIDDEGIWHCLLVKPHGHKEGVLALSDVKGIPAYVAVFWNHRKLQT